MNERSRFAGEILEETEGGGGDLGVGRGRRGGVV